eukprot:m.115431 g.115431  ORF g.115431 m.115431 type:complete len:174 (+) comp9476_c0_seq4:3-524(+)
MGKSNGKRKAPPDFKKKKAKVGRKQIAENATNTTFKSRSIHVATRVLPTQGEATSDRGQTLQVKTSPPRHLQSHLPWSRVESGCTCVNWRIEQAEAPFMGPVRGCVLVCSTGTWTHSALRRSSCPCAAFLAPAGCRICLQRLHITMLACAAMQSRACGVSLSAIPSGSMQPPS